jgi:uncharacterized integral membrane protein
VRHRFAVGLLAGAAVALLALFHAGPVELALLRDSFQVSSGLVHLLLVVSGIVIGWILRDERGPANAVGGRDAWRDHT